MRIYDAESYYRFSQFVKSWIATSGVMNYCEEHKCYWVLDCIASYVPQLKNADYLKIIEVKVDVEKGSAVFIIHDEINGELVQQDILCTDLKEDVKFWGITEGEKTVILLPSEY